MDLVSKENNVETVLQYHDHLSKQYPLELMAIYLPAFERKGDKADSRKAYADLAYKMKMVLKDIPAGKGKMMALAQRLRQKYPRRPAMIDELNKILN